MTGSAAQTTYLPGVLDVDYHEGRKSSLAFRYRLGRRTSEVLRATERHRDGAPARLLDISTADALMLSAIHRKHPDCACVGVDYSAALLSTSAAAAVEVMVSDAQQLPFLPQSFDVVVCTAVIEHLARPAALIEEAFLVLRSGGLLVVSSPDPFWEKVAVWVGHEAEEEHFAELPIAEIARLFDAGGFEVLEKRRFMLSPIGMPFEHGVESLVGGLKIEFLFANQIVAGRKP